LCRKLVDLVHLVHLVDLVIPTQPNKQDKPNKPNKQASLAGLFSLLLVVLIMGIAGTAHAQYASSCGRSWSPSQVPGTGFLEVVPSLCVSERYDSNVFFRPPTPGLQRDDFVTNVTTVFRVNFNGKYASAVLNAGGFGEAYIKNPNLNYLGTVNSLNLNLDNTIKRWLPNASLRIVEAVSYTPLPPGFANPTPGTSPDDPGNIQDVYAQGILFQRTNNLRNSGTVSASYATTAMTSLNASYSYSLIRFGSSPSAEGVDPNLTQKPTNLFNTTSQTGAVGGTARLSELDTMNIRYAHTQSEFNSGATSRFFITDKATIGWSRTLTPNFRTELGGGGILISPGLTTYAANAALIMNFQNNSATISYLRSAFPSFVNDGEPLIGDRFSLSAIQMIDRKWQLSETANYMHSTGGAGIDRNTYFASVGLNYWITGIWSTSLNYQYMNNNYSQSGASSNNFDRHVIMFSVNTSWE
jgi:hypothetical protein